MEMVWRGRGVECWEGCGKGWDVGKGWSGMHGRDAGRCTGVRSGRRGEGAGMRARVGARVGAWGKAARVG